MGYDEAHDFARRFRTSNVPGLYDKAIDMLARLDGSLDKRVRTALCDQILTAIGSKDCYRCGNAIRVAGKALLQDASIVSKLEGLLNDQTELEWEYVPARTFREEKGSTEYATIYEVGVHPEQPAPTVAELAGAALKEIHKLKENPGKRTIPRTKARYEVYCTNGSVIPALEVKKMRDGTSSILSMTGEWITSEKREIKKIERLSSR
jgi:hypothetical protein